MAIKKSEQKITVDKETLLFVINGEKEFPFEDICNGKGARQITFVIELISIINNKQVKVTEVPLALEVHEVKRKAGRHTGYNFLGYCPQIEGEFRGYYNPKNHKGWIVKDIENKRLN